jgi:hypothetical protein
MPSLAKFICLVLLRWEPICPRTPLISNGKFPDFIRPHDETLRVARSHGDEEDEEGDDEDDVAKALDEVITVEGVSVRKSEVGSGSFAILKGQSERLDELEKAYRENNITYPRADDDYLATDHRNMTATPSSHTTWNRFMERARTIAHRDSCPMTVAMQRARGEMGADHIAELRQPVSAVKKLGLPKTPPLYPQSEAETMEEGGRKKAKTHLGRRHKKHTQQVPTHEDMVAKEMAKGLSRELAEQRVLYQYGNLLPRSNILKGAGDSLVTRFMAKCDQVMLDENCDRTEAMRRVRKRNEGLFDAFQIV